MKKEILNETVNVVMDEQQMQQYVEENIHMVPKNQRKKFDTMTLNEKIEKMQYYQDRAVKIEQWKQSASIVNKVRDLFDKRHATIDDAKEVIKFAQEFVDNFRQHQIEEIDKKIAELEQMKESI